MRRGNYRLKDLKRKPVIASRVSCEIRSVGNKGPLSSGVLKSTAGFANDDNLDERCGSGFRCSISIPRPVMKTRQKTTLGS